MFDAKSLNTVEYPKILKMLSGFTQSEGAREKALTLMPADSLPLCERLLDETAEADRVLFEFSVNPSFAVDRIEEILTKAEKGSVLSIGEIIKVGRAIRVSRRVRKAISALNSIPILSGMASGLYFDEELEKNIFDSFLSETEVADNASPELRAIRLRIRKLNENVRTRLQGFITSPAYSKVLQDNIVTMRSGRYVIPVKSDFKGSVDGLVHDQSASGSTLFIEPMQVVQLNNELKVEKMNEQAEIERILRNFSISVRAHSDRIEQSYQIILDMDLIFAKAQLARSMKAVRPELNENGIIEIKAGRHPLIDPSRVVAISLSLGEGDRMLLITGPNTGGKTVTLKLAGLFALMAMSGLYLPAKSVNMSVFDGVYSDIGDEQSIEQSLSTFSAHIKNIIEILDKITDRSLVLFDELGAGTDPGEGAALAVSISEKLIGSGARSFITSHFNDLKEFALTTNGVAAASMEFDAVTFSPTFKLVMGAIGSSNALDIASRLGLDKTIIEDARGRLSGEKRKFDSVLTAAEETRRRAEALVGEASLDRELAASARREAEKERKILAEKREKLDENIRKETKRLIEESAEEAESIIEEMRELLDKPELEDADLFTARKLKKKLENMSAEYDKESVTEDEPDNSAPLKEGEYVWVRSLSKKGKLLKLSQRGEAEVAFGKINVKVKHGDFYRVKQR